MVGKTASFISEINILNPDVLIMDEAMSAVDEYQEKLITERLLKEKI